MFFINEFLYKYEFFIINSYLTRILHNFSESIMKFV
jgi:hypothetical protein